MASKDSLSYKMCIFMCSSLCCSHRKPSADVPGGLITYGAADTQNCDAQVDYVPLSNKARWQFEWDGYVRRSIRSFLRFINYFSREHGSVINFSFSVGKSNFPGKQQVISATGSSYLYLLTPHFNALIKELGAELSDYGFFTVDCNATNLPDIVLTICGKQYNIPPSEYVLDVSLSRLKQTVLLADHSFR